MGGAARIRSLRASLAAVLGLTLVTDACDAVPAPPASE